MTTLNLKKVEKSYGALDVIRGVDLQINSGELVVFVGPSGCGKSTLLRMIAGLEPITRGELQIGGERMNEVEAAKRGIAMVFQSYALYPHMSVRKNMSFGLETIKMPKDEIKKRVDRAGEILQISHLLDRKPKALSGGQRQRVAIGRAIVRDPKIFLFDEPLSNLDAELRAQTRVEIANLHSEIGATMIYVTHDQVEAMTLADRIVVLRGGVIEQQGAPLELYNNPANKFVAGFIGSPKMNFLEAKARGRSDTGLLMDLAGGQVELPGQHAAAEGQKITLGVRPEHLEIAAAGTTGGIDLGEVKIIHVEQLGGQTIAYGKLGEQPMTVSLDGQRKISAGEAIHVGIAPQNCHLFDENGQRI